MTTYTRQSPHPPGNGELRPVTDLTVHEAAGLVPSMNADEFRAFRDDIARRGIQVPLDITAKGVVLDGRTRLAAATELGWDKVPVRTVNPADQREYVLL